MDDIDFLSRNAPAAAEPGEETVARAREALADRMAAGERSATQLGTGRGRHVRLWTGLAAAAVAAAALIFAFALGGGPGEPDSAAAAALHKVAAVALKQRAQAPLDAGEYMYIKSEGVNLALAAATNMVSLNARFSFVREVWMGEHSRLRETTGKPEFVTQRDRENWIAAGRPNILQSGTSEDSLGTYEPLVLPTDAAELFDRLKADAQGHGTGLYNEMFVLIGDDLRETSASPAERAALYEVAARIPGVELVGNVTDPAGRTGVAVAMTDTTNKMRQTLIFDPQTAQLLAEEQTVVAGNEFGWPAGTLVGRTTYLVHAVVSSNSAVPVAQK